MMSPRKFGKKKGQAPGRKASVNEAHFFPPLPLGGKTDEGVEVGTNPGGVLGALNRARRIRKEGGRYQLVEVRPLGLMLGGRSAGSGTMVITPLP